ncbi:MAG: GGDEF domain-containing protein [Treponema sp.]|nr:GGDEF domain-containing protein [Treponema sp.]
MTKRDIQKQIIIGSILALFTVSSILLNHVTPDFSMHTAKDFHILLAKNVKDSIKECTESPILVSKIMGKSQNAIELLQSEKGLSRSENEKLIGSWLHEIKENGGFDSTFLISDKTGIYYTSEGILEAQATVRDTLTIWYEDFKNKDQPLDINVAREAFEGNYWSIFTNQKISGQAGEHLGIFGVSVKMEKLQSIFTKYEKEYNIKLNLVDKDGLTEVDTSSINIQSTYHTTQPFSTEKEFNYISRNNDFTITSYVPDLGWYLIVKNSNDIHSIDKLHLPFIFGSITLFFIFLTLTHYTMKGLFATDRPGSSNGKRIDPLTGLYNRNYFKQVYGERGIFNTTRYKSIAVFDIDFFKEANDTLDGDEVLKKVTKCARRTIGANGEIFRWGGDEFAVLMEESPEKAYESAQVFCKAVESLRQVTVSVGVTEVRLSDTIKKNYYRAAQGCYIVKEMGGNGVKKS